MYTQECVGRQEHQAATCQGLGKASRELHLACIRHVTSDTYPKRSAHPLLKDNRGRDHDGQLGTFTFACARNLHITTGKKQNAKPAPAPAIGLCLACTN